MKAKPHKATSRKKLNNQQIAPRDGAPTEPTKTCNRGSATPWRELLAAAHAAASNAYCPYSRFAVGAALLADDGRIFTGVNVENASYGLTVCAERAALFAAVTAGARRFQALALIAGARTPATPCGACRQVLAEFCDDRLPVFCGARTGTAVKRTTLGALLPKAFRLKVGNRRSCAKSKGW